MTLEYTFLVLTYLLWCGVLSISFPKFSICVFHVLLLNLRFLSSHNMEHVFNSSPLESGRGRRSMSLRQAWVAGWSPSQREEDGMRMSADWFLFCLLSIWPKLKLSGKREYQLRKCLHQTDISASLWSIFPQTYDHCGRPTEVGVTLK